MHEYPEFRARGLTVTYDKLRLNITHTEEDMQQLEVSQGRVSDEVSHEIELALEAAVAYLNEQQTEILCGINTFFVKEDVLMMSQHGPGNVVNTAEMAGEMSMLHDRRQAKAMLDKIHSSCEGVLLAAQESVSRDLALRFEQLGSTLPWTLNDTTRPIE